MSNTFRVFSCLKTKCAMCIKNRMATTNAVRFIRKRVFGVSQAVLAGHLNTTQATISRWEDKGLIPSDRQAEVRALAARLGKEWSDTWFFEVPADSDEVAA